MKKPENYSEIIVINFIQSLLIDNKEPIYLTTQDIQDKVADMAEIELNQIAEIMFSCGFKVTFFYILHIGALFAVRRAVSCLFIIPQELIHLK